MFYSMRVDPSEIKRRQFSLRKPMGPIILFDAENDPKNQKEDIYISPVMR